MHVHRFPHGSNAVFTGRRRDALRTCFRVFAGARTHIGAGHTPAFSSCVVSLSLPHAGERRTGPAREEQFSPAGKGLLPAYKGVRAGNSLESVSFFSVCSPGYQCYAHGFPSRLLPLFSEEDRFLFPRTFYSIKKLSKQALQLKMPRNTSFQARKENQCRGVNGRRKTGSISGEKAGRGWRARGRCGRKSCCGKEAPAGLGGRTVGCFGVPAEDHCGHDGRKQRKEGRAL